MVSVEIQSRLICDINNNSGYFNFFPVIGGRRFDSEDAADLAIYFDVGGIVGKINWHLRCYISYAISTK